MHKSNVTTEISLHFDLETFRQFWLHFHRATHAYIIW